jgi:hypothetical protein
MQLFLLKGRRAPVFLEFLPSELEASPYLPPYSFWECEANAGRQPEPIFDEAAAVDAMSGIEDEQLRALADLLDRQDYLDQMEHGQSVNLQAQRERTKQFMPLRRTSAIRRPENANVVDDNSGTDAAPPVVDAGLPSSSSGSRDGLEIVHGRIEGRIVVAEPIADERAGRVERPIRCRERTVDAYPRCFHPGGPGPLNAQFLRTVDNPGLGYKDLKAFCGYHPKFTMSRTCNKGARQSQGRPAGLLWHFLDIASQTANKEEHKKQTLSSLAQVRRDARRRLKAQPGSDDLFKNEREKRPMENSEPEDCP